MKKLVVLVMLVVLLTVVSAVYADTGQAAAATRAGTAHGQIDLQVGAKDPFADWNCPTAVFSLPTKCIYP